MELNGKELKEFAENEDALIKKYITGLKVRSEGDPDIVLIGLMNAIDYLSREHARAVAVVSKKDATKAQVESGRFFTSLCVGTRSRLEKVLRDRGMILIVTNMPRPERTETQMYLNPGGMLAGHRFSLVVIRPDVKRDKRLKEWVQNYVFTALSEPESLVVFEGPISPVWML